MRILVADDDPDFRTLAARAMRREFPEAEIVEIMDQPGLDQALAGKRPDLLVTDLQLNWTDGFAIFQAVRAICPHCAAVMFTGTGSEEVAVRAIKAGFDDYVVKSPRRFAHLAATARAAVTRSETRRALEQNRDLLTQELYHRLHNNLQLVVGLVGFTARAIADLDARAKLEDLGRRVQSLSLLQERLYRGGDFRQVDFAGFLRQLAEDLVALDSRGAAATVEAGEARLPVDLAVPLALVANELVTNALKHGAFQGAGIAIAFRYGQDGACILEVANDIAPPPRSESPDGLGMRLIHRLAQQVGGTIELAEEGGRRRCRLTVRARAPSGS
jgi:two-component sensor histidine kinase/CheY-like chemotaxis protein